jgi:preprotein translocase subunit SecA
MSQNMDINYAQKDHFGSVVWQDVEDMKITVDGENKHVVDTGFEQMKTKYPDSDPKVDQFIVRYVDELGDEPITERCIRLQNGFLSTEREAADWEKRNTLAKEQYMENFLKEAGITLNKKKLVGPKVGRNDACPCGSGKKYKKCCMNKKAFTGVAKDNAESLKTYVDEAVKPTKKVK